MSSSRPIVNLKQLPEDSHWELSDASRAVHQRLGVGGLAWRVRELLNKQELSALQDFGRANCSQPVGHDGILAHYNDNDPVGSWRTSVFAPRLAQRLWQRLQGLPWPEQLGAQGHSDWDGHSKWKACGVNPLFRFIQYRPGAGELVAHYDAPYVESLTRRTLFSLLLYLSSNPRDGFTRFLHDPQDVLALDKRDFSDWSRCAQGSEVRMGCIAVQGDALVFEHRLLHDSSAMRESTKLVARTDIVFEKVL